MDGVLSQEEITALLNNSDGSGSEDSSGGDGGGSSSISADERDTIGEIANISMGTAATSGDYRTGLASYHVGTA